jgi:putative transposase
LASGEEEWEIRRDREESAAIERDGERVDGSEAGVGLDENGAGYFKKSSRVLCEGVAVRYAMVKRLRLSYSVPLLCRMLGLSSSGYYAWLNRRPSRRKLEEMRLEVEIKAAHQRMRETYGPERLQVELAENGIEVGIYRIKRIRKKLGLKCRQKRRFKATTNSRHTLPVADNLLNQEFATEVPNRIWLSDITYVPTKEGWLYLAGHKDLFTNEIVGYAMSDNMKQQLIIESLNMAVRFKCPAPGLIHHSDRGSQYCSQDYDLLLNRFGMTASMSRKGNCYDNAPMESFWGTLKSELVHHRRYATREEAIRDITEYIEIFYNRQRRQARLNYLSPAAYERMYYEKLQREKQLAA